VTFSYECHLEIILLTCLFTHHFGCDVQAAEYVEKILKPRQEEKRRQREMHFSRLLGHPVDEGHILGVIVLAFMPLPAINYRYWRHSVYGLSVHSCVIMYFQSYVPLYFYVC